MNKIINIVVIIILVLASFFIGYTLNAPESSSSEIETLQEQISNLQQQNSQLQNQINEISQTTTDYWINPTISCSLNDRETPIKQYPYEGGLTDEERNNPSGLVEFCSRIESRFENSEVPISQANEIYTAIFNEKIIRDGSYGMPSPDTPPRPELTLDDIKERVKIKKIDTDKYEIFYTNSGCGTNYEHESINLVNGQISNRDRIEAWSGSYPC
ncbi:MAG TPA: hypothetical protein QGG70_00850 [Candidatus Pacearchaeota archaeon]|jgi:hypothetical protein|nr:hypothetical protein [Candidatus Pacearchaeota archaeon]